VTARPWLLLPILLVVTSCSSDATTAPSSSVSSSTTSTSIAPTTTIEPGSTAAAVFDFPTAAAIEGWLTVNDGVMGGVSTGSLSWQDGALIFEGSLSLDNNGGFASAVSPTLAEPVAAWSSSDGLTLDVVGDGRTYLLEVRKAGQAGGWIQRFPTTEGVEDTVNLPWSAFESVDRFLNPADPAAPLDRSTIDALAIYILDKQIGPFRLAVRAIR